MNGLKQYGDIGGQDSIERDEEAVADGEVGPGGHGDVVKGGQEYLDKWVAKSLPKHRQTLTDKD